MHKLLFGFMSFRNNYVIKGNETYHDIATEAHQLNISNNVR